MIGRLPLLAIAPALGAVLLTACSSGGSDATPIATAEPPAPSPTFDWAALYYPTTEPRPTAAPVTPVPATDAGRTDCPLDWAAFNDPDGYFSLCYPMEWRAIAGPAPPLGTSFNLLINGVSFAVHWREASAFYSGIVDERCSVEEGLWENIQEAIIEIGGGQIPGCTGEPVDTEGDPELKGCCLGTSAEIPIRDGEDGFVRLSVIQRKDIPQEDADSVSRVLQSLRVRE